jgi:glutamate-ammonia-ligase adenylyltransferase
MAWTLAIFAGSAYLSHILCRQPDLLFWLLDGALCAQPPEPTQLDTDLAQRLQDKESEAEVAAALRVFTLQHLLRIGARDLNGLADVETTTADLSALADCVVQKGLATCQRWLEARYGQPLYTDEQGVQHPCHFCVIGMGKLGGYELNFSSDIDLMYVYTSYQGATRGVWRDGAWHNSISNHEFFMALARRLTNLMGGKGPEGQAFRVDLRLRPNGTQGQLALSLLSYEAYYTRMGQTWERMALLKARPMAGEKELGDAFMALIRPFVYQRHLDPEGLQRIGEIKRQIDVQIADKAQALTNVKLGLGGIREIEFFIQILQLIFGGRHPVIQQRHSLQALGRLRQIGLITDAVAATLRDTYCYLRRVEHLLQMEQGSQTHTLPRGEASRHRLARLCGFANWDLFYQDYLARTDAVHRIFQMAFEPSSYPQSAWSADHEPTC